MFHSSTEAGFIVIYARFYADDSRAPDTLFFKIFNLYAAKYHSAFKN